MLEILTYQIVVCVHLRTQDCLFVVKGIQVLCYHIIYLNKNTIPGKISRDYLRIKKTAQDCLGFLVKMNISVLRAITQGKKLAKKNPLISVVAKSTELFLPDNIRPLHGHMNGWLYNPL